MPVWVLSVHNGHPGTLAINAYSMHPLKLLNVRVMVVSWPLIMMNAIWMRKYRNHGMVDRNHIILGVNLRMQPLQCIVLSHGLIDFRDN